MSKQESIPAPMPVDIQLVYVTMQVYYKRSDFVEPLSQVQVKEIIEDGDDSKFRYVVTSVKFGE